MARSKATVKVNTFKGGLITEASPLEFPESSAIAIDNCEVLQTAEIIRRLGVDYETDYELSGSLGTDAAYNDKIINTQVWKAVAGSGLRQFLVKQIGSILYFYDQAVTPLSSGRKSFTIDLDDHLAPSATISSDSPVDTTSGRGLLFVVSAAINPFKVEYDVATDTISSTTIEFQVRDLDGLDDGLEVTEELSTLSSEHEYNLMNQGWTSSSYDPISSYYSTTGFYPTNSQVPWTHIVDVDTEEAGQRLGRVNPIRLRNDPLSSTESAKGSFLLNPFFKDRSSVSGVSGLDTETTTTRPSSVTFFAGRVVYGGVTDGPHGGDIFISQVLNTKSDNAGKCYQVGDPTSPNDADLAANDGAVIPIPEAGNVIGLASTGTALVILASNGTWIIAGSDGAGFKATNFQVSKIKGTDSGCISKGSIELVDTSVVWWAKTGIYTTVTDNVTLLPTAQNITDETIKTLYNSINPIDKANAKAVYDGVANKVIWVYKDSSTAPEDTHDNYFNKMLTFNTLSGAFYPSTISSLVSDSPYICGVFPTPLISDVVVSELVTVSDVTVTVGGEDVTIGGVGRVRNSVLSGFLITVPSPSADRNDTTMGQLLNSNFVDWETTDGAGADYSSYTEVGYYTVGDPSKIKQATTLTVHMRRTETGFVVDPDGGDGYIFINPSSCLYQAKWEWTDEDSSNRWSALTQIYKTGQYWVVDPATLDFDNGFPITTSRQNPPGKGRALVIRFESETGKDFKILGWSLEYEGMSSV